MLSRNFFVSPLTAYAVALALGSSLGTAGRARAQDETEEADGGTQEETASEQGETSADGVSESSAEASEDSDESGPAVSSDNTAESSATPAARPSLRDAERPGEEPSDPESSESYAWGEDPEAEGPPRADDPLRVMVFAGAGLGARIVRNLDFSQDFMTPVYAELSSAVFFEGGDLRHGVGLGVGTNLTDDGPVPNGGLMAAEQWYLTPSYYLLLPFQRLAGMDYDWIQAQFRVGVPLVLSATRGTDEVQFSVGGELGAAFIVKPLARVGLYVEATVSIHGGADDTIHPIVAGDAGFIFDYEVLP